MFGLLDKSPGILLLQKRIPYYWSSGIAESIVGKWPPGNDTNDQVTTSDAIANYATISISINSLNLHLPNATQKKFSGSSPSLIVWLEYVI